MQPLIIMIALGTLTAFAGLLAQDAPSSVAAPTRTHQEPDAAAARPAPRTMRLVVTQEIRQRFSPGITLENAPVFNDSGPPTGNWLLCDLRINDMPDTIRVMTATTLSESASDDRNTDLIRSIKTRIDNDEIVRIGRDIAPEANGSAIRWYIGGPARGATTFDASLRVQAKVSARRDSLVIKPTREWQRLDHPSINHLNVEYRWRTRDGDVALLEMRPPAVEEYIYFLEPRPRTRPYHRPRFNSSDSTSGKFTLDRGTSEGTDVRLAIHADITTFEAVLTLDDEPLP